MGMATLITVQGVSLTARKDDAGASITDAKGDVAHVTTAHFSCQALR